MSADLQARITETWLALGKPESCYPTPDQLVLFMRTADDDVAREVADRMIQTIQDAQRRWQIQWRRETRSA